MPSAVQSVLGPVAPDLLGRVDAHEHLFITSPALPGDDYDDLHRVLLGTDTARRGMLRAYGGGPGMDVLGRSFLPRLERRVGGAAVERIMRENPARVLPAVEPPGRT